MEREREGEREGEREKDRWRELEIDDLHEIIILLHLCLNQVSIILGQAF